MALSDEKKVQTMINEVGQQALVVRAAVAAMIAVRVQFQAINPDTTGTALAGNEVAVSQAINALDAAANDANFDTMIDAIVPTHKNNAL